MIIKRLLKAIILPVLLLMGVAAFAQDRVVTGTVTDSKTGAGIPAASVTVKGTKIGVLTGSDGSYSLKVPADAKTLVISSTGFGRQEIAISGTSASASLVQVSTDLNEVVVVAYGTRKKGDLTGSVTAVSAKDFQKGNIQSSEQLLQGKVAGLQVTSGGGSAGGGSRIRIRGGASLNASNDPLIVVDGIPVESNTLPGSANYLNTINPNDIESMSVLKDASATALYGSRASNGVIIITTKKGAKGKIKFNYNAQVSLSNVYKYKDVLTADEIRSVITADAAATGNNTFKNLLGNSNTDWQKEIFQDALGFDNNISASGALGVVPFRASVGYTNQEGVLKTNKFDRISTSLNLSPKFFKDYLSVSLSAKYTHTTNRFADENAVGAAASFDPTQSVNSSNKFGGYYEWLNANNQPIGSGAGSSTPNPLGLLMFRHNNSKADRLLANVQVDYKLHFFPDLHVMVNLGVDNASGSGNDNKDSIMVTDYATHGRFTYYEQSKENYLADVSLFYAKEIKSINSKVDVLVGHSYQDFITNVRNFASFSQRFAGDTIPGTTPTFKTDKPEYRLESYIGRVNFAVADKYLLTASLRRDASSKFSPDTRVGYFPAVALAWKLKEEFFKNSNVVADMKLRASWGVTGQQDIGNLYPYLPRYAQSNETAQYLFGNTYYSFLRPSAYDANIKWETTTTTNIGLDFGFLKNRITGSIDVYQKKTEDLLSVIPVAPGSNFDISLFTNVGNMENKGVEFVLNTVPVQTKNVVWNFGFNVTYNKSEITNLLKQPDPSFKGIDVATISGGTGNQIGKYAVGYAPFTYFVYKQVYDESTGKPIEGLYEDINRDGKVDAADRYLYKQPSPDVLLGINTQLSIDKFSIGVAAHGAFGNYLYNNYNSNNGLLRAMKNPLNYISNVSVDYRNTGFANNQFLSDYYVENASYLRLDNINFGYNVGKIWNNKASMRLSASIQNVFVITNYSGLDPESSSNEGIDNNIYPRPRVYSLGVNLDF